MAVPNEVRADRFRNIMHRRKYIYLCVLKSEGEVRDLKEERVKKRVE